MGQSVNHAHFYTSAVADIPIKVVQKSNSVE